MDPPGIRTYLVELCDFLAMLGIETSETSFNELKPINGTELKPINGPDPARCFTCFQEL